jgi:hypothetical protein
MTWAKVTLTQQQVEAGRTVDPLVQFLNIFCALEEPEDMAVFSKLLPEGDRIFYFTPTATLHCLSIITDFSGKSCNKPDREGVFFLGGHESTRHLFG